MSRLPKIDKKPKNNKSTKFRWVDSQWEKFMTRHNEDTKIIEQLREDLVVCNKHFQKQRVELEETKEQLRDLVSRVPSHYLTGGK